MSKHDNKIVVDLGKVQYARFRYRNQHGHTRDTLLNKASFSIYGVVYDKEESALDLLDKPAESLYIRAARRGGVDVWIPEVKLQLQANHSLVYTGPKAKSIWKEWNRKIFKKG